ncbi:MAG: DNA repair protein RadA [Phycisphaeraceae bacterium]|nr:DNA repair protein RadA [Phycisphaerales bacterium]MCB9859616.1 DNA repair protein RadA [Phycisphaeraceae bacterium]
MAKDRTIYVCSGCGVTASGWVGKCSACGAWDTMVEKTERKQTAAKARPLVEMGSAVKPRALQPAEHDGVSGNIGGWSLHDTDTAPEPISMTDALQSAPTHTRISTTINELDRVLGDGIVAGSAVLVGGPPGIGKSTLLLQSAMALAHAGHKVLYVSSEESAQQIASRAARLATGQSQGNDTLHILADTDLARIADRIIEQQPALVIIDSIQMMYRPDVDAGAGSITQVRRCCADLVLLAKRTGSAVIMVGHVTKEGSLAGPKLLEHLVDTVLSFEGDRAQGYRLVRAVKNRFGRTGELGLFEMTGTGLREMADGAAPWLADDHWAQSRAGAVICPAITGARCVLVEIQALTATGFLGAAKRKASGIDSSRLAMLIAVLESHAEMRLADRDVFTSSVGGLRVTEPAADLALLLAIAGAERKQAVPARCVVVGEVGLGGEVRPVAQVNERLHEAARLGAQVAIVPAMSKRSAIEKIKGLELVHVKDVNEAIDQLA